MCVPALLVLARRCFDRSFNLRWTRVHAVMALLAVWVGASVWWAGDKFTAAVSGVNFIAAMVLIWAASQVVRRWLHLRVVAAAAFGLLLVYVATGLEKRFIDHPATLKMWNDRESPVSRERYLREHNLKASDFAFKQFETKLLSNEIYPFTRSPNSYAAALVLLGIVSGGVALQRWRDGDGRGWVMSIGGAILLAGLTLYYTRSRTAAITAIGAVGAFANPHAAGRERMAGAARDACVCGRIDPVCAGYGRGGGAWDVSPFTAG